MGMTEAAKALAVTNHTLRRLTKTGVLPAEQVVAGAPYQIAELLADRSALLGTASIDRAFDLSNRASMRRTASRASGEIAAAVWPYALRRAFSARSAMTKNGRRAWTQQAASKTGPDLRSGS
jgi:hypothetical protein